MPKPTWLPHFRTDYYAVVQCQCGRCDHKKSALRIPRDAVDTFPDVLELKSLYAFGRHFFVRGTLIR